MPSVVGTNSVERNPYVSPRTGRNGHDGEDGGMNGCAESNVTPPQQHGDHSNKRVHSQKSRPPNNRTDSQDKTKTTHPDNKGTKKDSSCSNRERFPNGKYQRANSSGKGDIHKGSAKPAERERTTCTSDEGATEKYKTKSKSKGEGQATSKSKNRYGDKGKSDKHQSTQDRKRNETIHHEQDNGSATSDARQSDDDDSSSSTKDGSNRKPKVVNALSRAVRKKLENYINNENRERTFEPSGKHRTTKAMHAYDLAYRLHELTAGEREEKRRCRKTSEERAGSISPRLQDTAQRVTLLAEARRLTEFANTVFNEVPVEKLSVIHRYRPHSRGVAHTPENGHVHNYSRATGGVLNTAHYVDYYTKEGLHSGSSDKSTRLQKLGKKKETKSDKSERDTTGNKSEKKASSDTDASEKSRGSRSNKSTNEDRKPKSRDQQQPRSRSSQWSMTEITARDEEGSRSQSRGSADQYAGSYADDFEEDDRSYVVSSQDNNSLSRQPGRQSPASRCRSRESSHPGDEYSDDFEADSRQGSQFNSRVSLRSKDKDPGDTASIRTYVSVEHAVEVKQDIDY